VSIEGTQLRHDLRVQALALIETLPIDTSGDGILDEDELGLARASIERYLLGHYHFFANGPEEASLTGHLVSLGLVLEGNPILPDSYWVETTFVYSCERPVEELTVQETLFEESNPRHVEYLSVSFAGENPQHQIFQSGQGSRRFAPTGDVRQGPFLGFFEMGTLHILSGYDHLLFLVALLVAVKNLKALAWVITAFTLSHSISLALAALGIVSLPGRFVELAIALSIVYVALETLLKLDKRSLWLEAFLFGLLHGLGFASFLGEALMSEDSIAVPLVGFNLGVEFGQLLVVVPLAFVLAFSRRLSRRFKDETTPSAANLVPVPMARIASAAIACLGLFWFVQRAGFLG